MESWLLHCTHAHTPYVQAVILKLAHPNNKCYCTPWWMGFLLLQVQYIQKVSTHNSRNETGLWNNYWYQPYILAQLDSNHKIIIIILLLRKGGVFLRRITCTQRYMLPNLKVWQHRVGVIICAVISDTWLNFTCTSVYTKFAESSLTLSRGGVWATLIIPCASVNTYVFTLIVHV